MKQAWLVAIILFANVAAAATLTAIHPASGISVCPCEEMPLSFSIKNNGRYDENYFLAVQVPDGFSTPAPMHSSLMPGEQKILNLHIQSQCSAAPSDGIIQASLTSSSGERNEKVVASTIEPCTDPQLELGLVATSCTGTDYVIGVINAGTRKLQATISHDISPLYSTLSQSKVILQPGERTAVKIALQGIPDEDVGKTFTVTAQSGDVARQLTIPLVKRCEQIAPTQIPTEEKTTPSTGSTQTPQSSQSSGASESPSFFSIFAAGALFPQGMALLALTALFVIVLASLLIHSRSREMEERREKSERKWKSSKARAEGIRRQVEDGL